MRVSPLLLLCLLLPASLRSQGQTIRFDRISAADGLTQGTVTCILQDSIGFLWFGTQDGLNRFDGSSFVAFQHDPAYPAGLANDSIQALVEDASGDVWVGTQSGGLSRWQRAADSFVHYQHDPDDPSTLASNLIQAIAQDRHGALWIGTNRSGLDRFEPATGVAEHFRHDPADPTSLSHDQIRAVHVDRGGRVWIGTLGGLNLFDAAQRTFRRFRHDPSDPGSLSDDRVRSILEDRSGALWIGTFGGLNRLDRKTLTFDRYLHAAADPASLSADRVRALFEDRDGRLWIGTDNGLNLLHRATGTFTANRHRPADVTSLSADRVMSIYQDRGGVLWVGTQRGVNKWNPVSWSFGAYRGDPSDPSDLSSNDILALSEDREGRLWIGTSGHGLNRLERGPSPARPRPVRRYRHDPNDPSSLADDRVTALLHDREGTLWIGTMAGGLNRFDSGSETFRRFTHDPGRDDSLGADGVMSLYEDRRGVLWVGTYGGGLNRLRSSTETFVRYVHDPGDPRSLSNDRVTAFAEEADGTLWIGTFNGGLNRFEREGGTFLSWRHDRQQSSALASDTVLSLHLDPGGTLWIGTQIGLHRLVELAGGRAAFEVYFERDGLPNDVIYGIHSDAEGRLWLATNNGLSRFDPRTETFKNFDVSHGLQAGEFHLGAHFRSPSGELFFGGVEGFNAFDPQHILTNASVPPIVLTSLAIANKPVDLGTPIFDVTSLALDYRDDQLSLEFAALDYTAPEKNRYRYKLEGFDDDWIDLGHRRRATFTNLDPGSYVLRVQGSNNDGVWNEAGVALRIAVAPPPWRTWWARSLYALALAAAIWGLVRLQQRKIEHQRIVIERSAAQVRERERFIAERDRLITELEAKNAELERFNYTVSHDLKSPLVTIKGFLGLLEQDAAAVRTDPGAEERMRHDVERISTAADRMHRLLDELLEFSRLGHEARPPEKVPLAEVADEAVELLGGLIAERAVEIAIAPDLPVVCGDRSRLLEVLQNLVQNAVVYMGDHSVPPRVEIGLRQQGELEVVYVRDNGLGIDARYHRKVFGLFERLDPDSNGTGVGLALVKRIVETHGGRVWVESAGLGHGSTFCFTLRRSEQGSGREG